MLSKSQKTGLISGYALSHGWVDAVSIYLVLGLLDVKSHLADYIILYNVLAFGLQLPFGLLSDKLQKPRLFSIAGILFIGLSVIVVSQPVLALLLVSTGNALFHVGGGTIALSVKPDKAFFPGLFVAPGGLGLFLGGVLAVKAQLPINLIFISGIIFIIWLLILRNPEINYQVQRIRLTAYFEPGLWLILLVIAIRSVIGLSFTFTWKDTLLMGVLLAFAITIGKGAGGWLADKFGWKRIVLWGFGIASILIFWGKVQVGSGLIAILLLNVSMPVTLTAVAKTFKGRPGFAFGLTTMALLIGALPTFLGVGSWFNNEYVAFILVILASVFFWLAAKWLLID